MTNREPIRVVEGKAAPNERFWRIVDAVDSGGVPSIEFYGYISEYLWWGDEITPKIFKDDLERIGKGGPIQIRINSGGGEITAASAIRSILTDYPGEVTARIDGLCASAATMVALGADKILIQDTAYFMVHDPGYSVLMGWLDATELAGLAEHLKLMKAGILDAYEYRTKLPREELSRMMRVETWMTAKQAVEFGFADQVVFGGTQVGLNASVANAIKMSANCPLSAVEEVSGVEDETQIESAESDKKRIEDQWNDLLDELLVI